MKTQELLTIEFRYMDAPENVSLAGCKTKIITIGVFDTILEAVNIGNNMLAILSQHFQVRKDDKFKVEGLFGYPNRLVSNCCYPTRGISYFAKITKLNFDGLQESVTDVFNARDRFDEYNRNNKES